MVSRSLGADNPAERKDRVPVVRDAIAASVLLVNSEYAQAVTSREVLYAHLVSNCNFLLSNAYKRSRLVDDNRTYDFKVATFMAAATMAVRPIRALRRPVPGEELFFWANFECATRVSTSLLDLPLDSLDTEFIRRFHRATLGRIDFPCLAPYLNRFDNLIFITERRNDLTFEEIETLIPFADYNDITLSPAEMLLAEQLMNVFYLMKAIVSKSTLPSSFAIQ